MKKIILFLFSFLFILAGCRVSIGDLFSSSNSQAPFPSTLSIAGNVEVGDGGKRFSDLNQMNGMPYLPSTGTQNILVIPVFFKNGKTCGSMPGGCETYLSRINSAFFGKSEETSWESVQSFYEKSSYGMLSIEGTVTEPFTLDKTVNEVAVASQEPTYYVVKKATEWYKSKYGGIKNFDRNKDGYIDGLWLIYGEDYESSTDSYLWAYTYWYTEANPSLSSPVPCTYAWASYDFMNDSGNQVTDAHTFIHETGHMLGLDDYYNYDTNQKTAPIGYLDMMDANIVDNNAFSKYLLGWIRPFRVTDATTITLPSLQQGGYALIVSKPKYYKSVLEEYLLIEYYTPTGLNEQDSFSPYKGSYPPGFTTPGFKIFHVDARLGKISFSGGNYYFSGMIDDPNKASVTSTSYYDIAQSNTPSRSNSGNTLLQLLSSTGRNNLYKERYANNDDLFVAGDQLVSYTFHDGTRVPYTITIDSVGASEGTIRFQKI